jgi:hypothetical protein
MRLPHSARWACLGVLAVLQIVLLRQWQVDAFFLQ